MKNKKPQYILTLMIISLMFLFSIGLSIWIITDTIIVKPSETNQTNQIIIEYLDKQDGTYNGNILLPSNTAFGLDINSERLTYSYKKENSDGTYPAEFTEVDLENQLGPIDAGNYKIKVSFVNYDNPETPIEQELDFVVKPRSIEDAVVVFDREDGNLFYVGHTYDNFVEKLQVSIVLVENAQATNLIIDDDFTVSTPDLSTLNNNAETTIIGKGNYTDELTVNYSVKNPQLIVELSTEHPAYDKNTGAYVFEYSKSGIDFNGVIIVKDPLTKEKVTPTSIEYSYKGLADQGDYINLGLPSTVAPYWVRAVVSLTGYDSVIVDSIQVKINPISISTADVTLEAITLTYNGAPQTKAVESVVFDGDTLVEGEDYEAPVYSNNIDAGNMKAVVTINGKGMYADSVKVYFTIEKATPTVTAPTYAKYAFIEGEQPKITTAGKGTFIKTKGDGTKETTPTVISGTIISKINGVDIDAHPFEEGDSSTKTVTVDYTFVPSDVNSNGTSNYKQETISGTLTMYGVAYNATKDMYWGTIEKGIKNAVANDKVWVVNGIYESTDLYPTIKSDVTVGDKITLGLSYDSADYTTGYVLFDENVTFEADKSTGTTARAVVSENGNLTISSGGVLIIGAYIGDCSAVGKHAVLMNNGNIIADEGSTVYSYGYTKGSGLFEAKPNSVINDVIRIYDFAGGRYAPGMYYKTYKLSSQTHNNILPFQSYSMHNISCEFKLFKGATFNGRVQLNVSGTIYDSNLVLFGENGLFQLQTEGGYVTRTVENTIYTTTFNSNWNSSNQDIYQKEVYEFHSSVRDNSIEINLKIADMVPVDIITGPSLAMAIGMMKIIITSGYKLSLMSNSWKMLPGTSLHIDSGAEFYINSGLQVVFYDEYYDNFVKIDQNGKATSPADFSYYNKHKSLYDSNNKVKTDYVSKVYINGTATCDGSLGGIIETTGTTGKIILSSGFARIARLSSIKYLDIGTGDITTVLTSGMDFGGVTYSDTQTSRMFLYNGKTISTKLSSVASGSYYSISSGGKYGWYTDKITISYDLNGGEGTVPPTTSEKDVVEGVGYVVTSSDIPTVRPTKLGYEFTGNWALDAEGNEIVIAGETAIYASSIFYPVWKPIEYTIDFEDKYYNDFASGQLEYDEFKFFVTDSKYFPDDNTISNGDYVFAGWYLDTDYTIRVYSTNDIYTHENASTYLSNTTIKLYGLWYPKDTQRILINYYSNNNDIDYLEFMSFIIATEDDWSKVKLQLLTSDDNNPKVGLYFGGWKINDTETIINTETYFNKDNYTNYFASDESNNLVCNLTAVWNEKNIINITYTINNSASDSESETSTYHYIPNSNVKFSKTDYLKSGYAYTATITNGSSNIDVNLDTDISTSGYAKEVSLIINNYKTYKVTLTLTGNTSYIASYSCKVNQYVSNDKLIISDANISSSEEITVIYDTTITISATATRSWGVYKKLDFINNDIKFADNYTNAGLFPDQTLENKPTSNGNGDAEIQIKGS